MEYIAKESSAKNNEPIASLKQHISDFTQIEIANFKLIVKTIDHHIANQRFKQQFQPLLFNQQTQVMLSGLQIYYTKLLVKMTEFPELVQLTKILQYFLTQSSKLYTFTNEHWYAQVRQLQTTRTIFHHPQPSMEVCMKCLENIRHQEIKKARFNITNLIDDPFLFYQRQDSNKSHVFQQIGQKSLQSKLSELASSVQFSQICMRELIQNLTIQSKQLGFSGLQAQKEREIKFIPLLKKMAQCVKAQKQRKLTFQIGLQTEFISNSKGTSNKLIFPQSKEAFENTSKMTCELSDKIKEIKNLQYKLQQENKMTNQFKTQISILRQDKNDLEKKNSALQIQLNLSKSKQIKTKKLLQVTNNIRNISDTIPRNLQAIQELSTNKEKQAQQSQIKHRDKNKKKSQFFSDLKKSVNLTSLHNYGKSIQKVYRKTQSFYNLQGSSKSIQKSFTCEEDEISESFESQLPIISSKYNNMQSKQISNRKQYNDLKPLNSSTLDITRQMYEGKVGKISKINKSTNQTQIYVTDIIDKKRRKGTVYDKQMLLKMLYDREIISNKSSINYKHFKVNYQNLIQKLIVKDKDKAKQNRKQSLSREQLNYESNSQQLSRQIQKKSTVSIKNLLRNEPISVSRNSSQSKAKKINVNQKSKQILSQLQLNIINQLKLLVVVEQKQQINKRTVLSKQELNLVTELMAYLAQLKFQNQLVYKQIKKIISYSLNQNRSESGKDQGDLLQVKIAEIIKNHRCCTQLQDSKYCIHIKQIFSKIIHLIR